MNPPKCTITLKTYYIGSRSDRSFIVDLCATQLSHSQTHWQWTCLLESDWPSGALGESPTHWWSSEVHKDLTIHSKQEELSITPVSSVSMSTDKKKQKEKIYLESKTLQSLTCFTVSGGWTWVILQKTTSSNIHYLTLLSRLRTVNLIKPEPLWLSSPSLQTVIQTLNSSPLLLHCTEE